MASTLPILFILSFLFMHRSSAARLRPGDYISANQTLTSGSGTFVLGFFSPSNSPSTSYLGVWCSGSDVRTAVWVANRRAPVPLSRAIFRLSNSSNLEVADKNGTLLWSSDTHPSDPKTTVAVLLDTGNLVLQREGGAGEILWQGFDHPTDTVLSGMPIWANYLIHNASTATSWRSPEDPSPGEFHLSIDPDTHFQGIIKRGSVKWWRGNVWSGEAFSTEGGSSSDTIVPYLAFTLSSNTWNISFSSSDLGATAWRLEYNGTAIIRVWLTKDKIWKTVYTFNAVPCESYGLCGAFGYCSPTSPTCSCLDGFEPRNRSEWDGGDHRGGCMRTHALTCDERDEFVKFEKMKLPDYNVYLKEVGNGSACREACRRNCSCVAFAYSDLWKGSETVPRCLVWARELLDLVARNDVVAQDDGAGEDLYVRVHIPKSGNKKDAKVVIVVSIVAGVALLVAVVACLLWRCRKPSEGKKDEEGRLAFTVTEGGEDHVPTLNGGADHQGLRDVPMLDYETVVAATDNFSDQNKIGRGGFGVVYKGKLSGGQEVAIKRLSEESTQGVVEFKNEVVLIAQLQHRNLVKLLGCCIHGEEKLLIYEFMPNKSLELFLFDTENERLLDWTKRFNIIKGIARGVRYLHEDSRLKIIHRDLKLSNILLDEDMNPKVSDFGMARIFGGGQSHANTKRVVGTYGYMSPEYAMEGLFSAKSDIYSFGVLLLEITSSQRNTSFISNTTFPRLLTCAWESWKGGNITEVVAPSIRDSCSLHEVMKCVHIGLLCVQDDPIQRPTMSSVVFMLENETPINATPSRPSFTGWAGQDDSTDRIRNSEAFSVNNLSISALVGR